MPGLVPGIHVFKTGEKRKDMDSTSRPPAAIATPMALVAWR
jgi:hypothetical protein